MKRRTLTALFLALVVLVSMLAPAGPLVIEAEAAATSGNAQAFAAAKSLYESYLAGTPMDSHEAYVLDQAGVNIGKWRHDGLALTDAIAANVEESATSGAGLTAKRLAQDYLGALTLEETTSAAMILETLATRQTNQQDGSLDGNIYSDLSAYDMLFSIGATTGSSLDLDLAAGYILVNQDPATGGWPISDWGPDSMATHEAIRSLAYMQGKVTEPAIDAAISEAIEAGLAYMASLQDSSGSYAGWDPVLDAAEAVITATFLGQNPEDWTSASSLGSSPVDYLLSKSWESLPVDTFDATLTAAWGLDAYTQLGYGFDAKLLHPAEIQASKAIESLKSVYAASGGLGSHEAYLLDVAGVDISLWVDNEDVLLIDAVAASIASSIAAAETVNTDETYGDSYAVSAKKLAEDYLGALALEDAASGEQLLGILAARQTDLGSGGFDIGSYTIYSDLHAYDKLFRAGVTTGSGLDLDLAASYILENQDASGGWPSGWADFMSTAQGVRTLDYLKDKTTATPAAIEAAIENGLAWIESKQLESGTYNVDPEWPDDPVIDASEAVRTALALGHDPDSWQAGSDLGNSPLDYLFSDSWQRLLAGTPDNAATYAMGLDAYTQLGTAYDAAILGSGEAHSGGEAQALAAIESLYGLYTASGGLGSYEAFLLEAAQVDISRWEDNGGALLTDAVAASVAASIADAEAINTDETYGDSYAVSAKKLAEDYLGTTVLEDAASGDQLLGILAARQTDLGTGGFDIGSYTIYSDLHAYDKLFRAGVTTGSGLDLDLAASYILENQDASGGWPSGWADFMSTTQGIRTLDYLKDKTTVTPAAIEAAIGSGLAWIESKQLGSGTYNVDPAWPDDPVVDASEAIRTALLLGSNPDTWYYGSTLGSSPVDYLFSDSWTSLLAGSNNNALTYALGLDAYTQLGFIADSSGIAPAPAPDNSTDSSSSSPSRVGVYVAVIGQGGEVLYEPDYLYLEEDDTYGITALGALDSTGLSWSFSDTFSEFVDSIEGQENHGLSGWMYAVNGRSPSVGAIDKVVSARDEVLWYYSEEAGAGIPAWPDEEDRQTQEDPGLTEETEPGSPIAIDPEKRLAFADVGDAYWWAEDAIEILAGNGLINGTGTGYEPSRAITRAEFVKIMAVAMGYDLPETPDGIFSDVDGSGFFAPYIESAYANGLVTGDPDGAFRPSDTISRHEIATILGRLGNTEDVPASYAPAFHDSAATPDWAADGLGFCAYNGILIGDEKGYFNGANSLTRAEAAVAIYRYLNYELQ